MQNGSDGAPTTVGPKHAVDPAAETLDEPATAQVQSPAASPSSPRTPINLEVGQLIDSTYRIVRHIGRGGMGQVVLARDQVLERDVAIKVLQPKAPPQDNHVRRFLNEARAMARVRHENVVSIYSFGVLDGAPYIVMEYVPGHNLEDWLAAHSEPSVDETMGILRQASAGLQAIHNAGAVHGDIKPGNILLGEAFRVAIADLGLARIMGAASRGSTLPGLSGTPSYIAPELILDKVVPELAPRIDIYALGVLAFRLLTGRMPFEDLTIHGQLTAHISTPPPRPSEVSSSALPAFDQAIEQALVKDPAHRTASAETFLAQLEAARAQYDRPTRKPCILVADDDDAFRDFICSVIRTGHADWDVTCVSDGVSALDLLEQRPHCIAILDLQMLGLNGLEVVAAIRQIPKDHRPRVVVATAVGTASDWRVLAGMGVDTFLLKPVSPHQLLNAIDRLAMEASGAIVEEKPVART